MRVQELLGCKQTVPAELGRPGGALPADAACPKRFPLPLRPKPTAQVIVARVGADWMLTAQPVPASSQTYLLDQVDPV